MFFECRVFFFLCVSLAVNLYSMEATPEERTSALEACTFSQEELSHISQTNSQHALGAFFKDAATTDIQNISKIIASYVIEAPEEKGLVSFFCSPVLHQRLSVYPHCVAFIPGTDYLIVVNGSVAEPIDVSTIVFDIAHRGGRHFPRFIAYALREDGAICGVDKSQDTMQKVELSVKAELPLKEAGFKRVKDFSSGIRTTFPVYHAVDKPAPERLMSKDGRYYVQIKQAAYSLHTFDPKNKLEPEYELQIFEVQREHELKRELSLAQLLLLKDVQSYVARKKVTPVQLPQSVSTLPEWLCNEITLQLARSAAKRSAGTKNRSDSSSQIVVLGRRLMDALAFSFW